MPSTWRQGQLSICDARWPHSALPRDPPSKDPLPSQGPSTYPGTLHALGGSLFPQGPSVPTWMPPSTLGPSIHPGVFIVPPGTLHPRTFCPPRKIPPIHSGASLTLQGPSTHPGTLCLSHDCITSSFFTSRHVGCFLPYYTENSTLQIVESIKTFSCLWLL